MTTHAITITTLPDGRHQAACSCAWTSPRWRQLRAADYQAEQHQRYHEEVRGMAARQGEGSEAR